MEKETVQENTPVERAPKKKKSRETFLGTFIFLCMIVFVLACLGALGFGGYSLWNKTAEEKSEPSIRSLATEKEESAPKEEEKAPEPAPQKEVASDETLSSAKSATISVLNGGAVKGTAGVAAEFLKGKGFTKVTAGNTTGDFTGTVVYFDSKSEAAAKMTAEVLREKYPQTTTLPAISTNKETSVSPITIIFGK